MQSTHTVAGTSSPALKADSRAGKYLTLIVGKAKFGVGVLKVREIMQVQQIAAMPQSPAWLKGVIDLRGQTIPVIDLCLKFGLPCIDSTQCECIVVIQINTGSSDLLVGIIVERVSEVITIASGDIETTSASGWTPTTPSALAAARLKGNVKILLDIDEVLTSQEIHRIEATIQ